MTKRLSLWPVLASLLFIAPSATAQELDVKTTFISEGVTSRVGGYRPIRAEMDQEADIADKVPEDLTAPKFGLIKLGDLEWAFILDEPEEGEARLFVDSNRDRDLTNDPAAEWTSTTNGGKTMYNGSCKIQLSDDQLGALGMYRFDPNDEQRAQLKNTLLFFVDYGFEFAFELDGKPFSTFVSGSVAENTSLPIDRDDSGSISQNYERVTVGKPFNFTGTTYEFLVKDGGLTLAKSAETLPEMPLPPDLRVGKTTLPFSATTMDGTEIEFPSHFAGKLVMLDFWATWCGPCIAELPNVKKAYADWHDQGFEVLGISFDGENETEKVEAFLKDRELAWPQIYEGKGWETTLGKLYDVSGIPFVLLIDGDTGEILGNARNLRGEGLSDFIGEQLEKKKGTK